MMESLEQLADDPKVQARLAEMQPVVEVSMKIVGRKPSLAEQTLTKVRAHSEFLHGQIFAKGTLS